MNNLVPNSSSGCIGQDTYLGSVDDMNNYEKEVRKWLVSRYIPEPKKSLRERIHLGNCNPEYQHYFDGVHSGYNHDYLHQGCHGSEGYPQTYLPGYIGGREVDASSGDLLNEVGDIALTMQEQIAQNIVLVLIIAAVIGIILARNYKLI